MHTFTYIFIYLQGREAGLTHDIRSFTTSTTAATSSTRLSISPRSVMSDRIRGTLSSLSGSLDLPAVPQPITSSRMSELPPRAATVTDGYSTTAVAVSSGSGEGASRVVGSVSSEGAPRVGGDNDLAARLQKLRNMDKK